jgi:hypothetical protein
MKVQESNANDARSGNDWNLPTASRGPRDCDLLTDQATGQIYTIFTTDRSAPEQCDRMAAFFDMHPYWLTNASPATHRYVRVDPENANDTY